MYGFTIVGHNDVDFCGQHHSFRPPFAIVLVLEVRPLNWKVVKVVGTAVMPSLQNAAPGAKSSKFQALNPFTPFLAQPVRYQRMILLPIPDNISDTM